MSKKQMVKSSLKRVGQFVGGAFIIFMVYILAVLLVKQIVSFTVWVWNLF